MNGLHQAENAATAFLALDILAGEGLDVPEDARRRGFTESFIPGRFQLLGSGPRIVLDGAHNPQAVATLRLARSARRRRNALAQPVVPRGTRYRSDTHCHFQTPASGYRDSHGRRS